MSSDRLRVSQIGLVARSPEGHAAKGMQIKGNEDLWVDIQANTFRNWVNEHLKSSDMKVVNLATDFFDGTKLCALVEVLQKRILRPGWNRKPVNQHQYLENVSCALNAVAEDGIKLVNIGNVDIVNGNLKLILGLIWSLIVRYQIGPSKFPPKKLMLAWLKAAVPDCNVNNLTTDWNSGINLAALLDYCQPGLFSNWRQLDSYDSIENCRTAMKIARKEFAVPMILEPEYLASPFLDELSGMTYLSYFMKEDSPGFRSTIRWVNSRLKNKPVRNFTTDWNDGRALCSLVKSLGVPAKYEESDNPEVWVSNLNAGINAGRKLGVEPLLRAKDMVDQNVEHLGVMAYAASFQWIPPRTHPSSVVTASYDSHTTRVYQPTNINLDFSSNEVNLKEITAEIIGPECNKVECRLTLGPSGGRGTFVPTQVGMHKIIVYNEEEIVRGCPIYIRAMPELTSIKHTGLEPCAVGSIVEVLVNSNGAKAGLIEVIATSPTGRDLLCPVNEKDSIYKASFEPDEPGEWSIAVRHSGELIQGGPFTCFVFDPNGVELLGLEAPAIPEGIFNFTLDARGTGGLGNIVIDIVHNKQSLPHTIDHIGNSIYRVSLHTRRPGKYKLYIYFNGNQIKGSPFPLRVGTKEQVKAERQHSFSKYVERNFHNSSYEYRESMNGNSDYHRMSSPSRSPSHSPSPLSRASPVNNIRNSESIMHKSAFKTTNNSSSKLVDSLLRSRLSPVNNLDRSSPSMINSSYKNSHSSSYNSVTRKNSSSPVNNYLNKSNSTNNSSVKYLNTSSNIRVSPTANHSKIVSHSNSRSPVNGAAPDIKVTGDALQLLPVNRASTIYIHTDATLPNVYVTVTSPSGSSLPIRLSRNMVENLVSATFTALEIGEHIIDVKIKDERIAKSPFRSHAYNANAIKVGTIPSGFVGQAVEFEIDGSGAGSGNLEILVNGGHVTSFVRNLGNQRFLASFVPHEPVVHKIDMKFNNEPVNGSPWEISVMSSGSIGPKMSVIGEAVRLVPANHIATFQISAIGFRRNDLRASVLSPSKRSLPTTIFSEGNSGVFRIEFMPTEVGSHLIDVSVAGEKLAGGPLVAKVYNSAYIHVTDVKNGIIGQPCQFKVDASEAGEGQLEISINEGEVPNHVTVVGGGRCLVSFTPEQPKPHLIDIKFNGETVSGCPFVCSVLDTSRVSVNLSSLELIPVNQVAKFHMTVDNSASAELSVSVTGPTSELPVKVTGNVHSGFTAEFMPQQVGPHTITVDYNGHPIYGTPFVCKVYDAKNVIVGNVPKGHVGNTLQFTVDASQAGEGNLEITISARGTNIPTQVHPQRNAKFMVSFVPIEPTDHVISIHFNKEPVPGSPFIASVSGDFPLVNGSALNSAPVGANSYFTMSNVSGNLEDIEVNVEGPNGQSVPALVKDVGNQTFKVEFCPKFVGEHKICVSYKKVPMAGSPFSCKVYDVNAIKVKPVLNGTVGQPVTFIIETSQAGPGNLEVTVNGGRVPTTAQGQGPHAYAISFTPRQAVVHTIDLRFNGKDVPGSPFTCSVSEAARVILSNEDKVSVEKPAKFIIECEASMGLPKVQVLSPSRIAVPVQVTPLESTDRYSAQFVPNDVGDHSVEVKLNGTHIEGSPFLIKAYDASKVRVTDINSGFVDKPVYFTINASQAGAGNLEIIVSVNGCNVPNYVQSEGNAKFKVNFKPREAAPHNLSVRFNGEPVPGSPFICKIFKNDQIVANEDGLKMCHVNRLATVTVDCPSNSAVCKVTVTPPSGHQLPVDTSTKVNNRILAKFTPVEVGHHTVHVEIDGNPIKGSPFTCNVYNVDKIKVTGLGTAKVGKPVTFSVDATEAGEGTLELVISTEHSTVKAEVVACSRGLYDVTFVPHQILPHFVNISFNEESLRGSPFRCDVVEIPNKKANTVSARGEGLSQVVLGSTAYFEINPHSPDHGPIDAQVLGPDSKPLSISMEKLESGLYRVKYKPIVVGNHTVTVWQRKQPISKHPWNVQVFDSTKVKMYDMSEAFCNQPASFKVDTRGAGSGALSLSIKAAASEVKHTLHELDTTGLYQVIYHPQLPIPHRIQVKYNNMYISGSPLEVPVSDPTVGQEVCAIGLGLYQSRANRVTNFTIYTAGYPHHDFDVVITGPQGNAVPVRCYQQKDGNLLTEFTAASTGVYKIDVLHGSRPIKGSPFLCQVFDASKVKIENIPNSTVSVNDNIMFKLVRKNAGFAELDVTVRSPLGQDLPLTVKSIGQETDLIELCPSLPGNYCFHVTYGGEPIPDSPLTFSVVDSGIARAWGPGLSKALVNSPSKFFISARGISIQGKPIVQIVGPDRCSVRNSIASSKSGNEGEYEVAFTPDTIGTYDVDVTWNGKHIPGSPFRCCVVNVNRVRPIGDNPLSGKLALMVNTTTRILFDVSQAGPGELIGTCEGPHSTTVPVNIEHLGPDTVQCVITPRSPGPHSLSLLYGGFPLPSSPFHGLAESGGSGVRVVLTGKGLASATCGQQAEFTVDGSQAGPGVPEVTLTGIKHDMEVSLQNIGDNIYKATYTPTQPGAYLLNVMWSDRQVKGCPLKVNVNAICDASKVLCTGDGLGTGTVGKDIRSFIDTRRAGPGELSAHCVGPHKVAYCELYDHGDGTFTLNVKPQEPGKHTLTVKYGGIDVPGSPFVLKVSGAPDPSKVKVYGPGIEHGVLAMFQSRFICDTRGAGAGQLTVRVRGPKGAFRVEMQRESHKDRTILCKFDPTEPGDYRVEVKWAGEHVPGSPFMVMIFDTQQELNRYLQGNHSPASDLYGSVAYSTGYAHITP